MDKNIDKKIKSLFEYQKFENDSELNQVIKDSLIDDSSLLSDLQLNSVSAGKYIKSTVDCPKCGGKNTLVRYIDSVTNKEECRCICGYTESK